MNRRNFLKATGVAAVAGWLAPKVAQPEDDWTAITEIDVQPMSLRSEDVWQLPEGSGEKVVLTGLDPSGFPLFSVLGTGKANLTKDWRIEWVD